MRYSDCDYDGTALHGEPACTDGEYDRAPSYYDYAYCSHYCHDYAYGACHDYCEHDDSSPCTRWHDYDCEPHAYYADDYSDHASDYYA